MINSDYKFSIDEIQAMMPDWTPSNNNRIIITPPCCKSPERQSVYIDVLGQVKTERPCQPKFDPFYGEPLWKRSFTRFTAKPEQTFETSAVERGNRRHHEEVSEILPHLHGNGFFFQDALDGRTNLFNPSSNRKKIMLKKVNSANLLGPGPPGARVGEAQNDPGNAKFSLKLADLLNEHPSGGPATGGTRLVPAESSREGDSEEKYSLLQLVFLFEFLLALFLNLDTLEHFFNQLTEQSKTLLLLFLRKAFGGLDEPIELVRFEDFRKLYDNYKSKKRKEKKFKNKKRNEEFFKLVYKQTLKVLERRFEYKIFSFTNELCKTRFHKFLKAKKSTFYLYLFKNIIRDPRIHEDLVMDVLFEKITFRGPQIEESGNWIRSDKKAMKKISPSVRLFVKKDPFARRQFMDFIDCDKGYGLIRYMKTVTAKKFEGKIKVFSDMLRGNQFDFEGFKADFERELDKKKFKCPWPIDEVKEAIEHCMEELNNPDDSSLEKEFLAIQKKHYTSTNN